MADWVNILVFLSVLSALVVKKAIYCFNHREQENKTYGMIEQNRVCFIIFV